MALPFFYISEFDTSKTEIVLDEETSKHIVQVLRMGERKKINLTDGKGALITAEITDAHKKRCSVKVINSRLMSHGTPKITIAISLVKNSNRFEWFLEKATEIGVSEIIPLICERTEKEKFRYERMSSICISAMLQSQQCWLPVLHHSMEFDNLMVCQFDNCKKLIAHCDEGSKQTITNLIMGTSAPYLICIGPEGDFTKEEIQSAIKNYFIPVSLGDTRLRTETAGIVAATLLCRT